MKRKRINLEKLGKPKSFGPYSVLTEMGYRHFFINATSQEEADELANIKADELENSATIVDKSALDILIESINPN